ncbi:hypothetical protein GCM10022263_42880 [Nocardioides daeguensis]|uniref:Uncharacterized protein n=1 Tax=Nocardioides daeguensis TaxID=908359 RepID=A0ABP6WJQ4_9ACTN
METVLGGRHDARLALAVEGVRRQRRRDLLGLGRREPPGGEGSGDAGGSRAAAEESAAADPAAGAQDVTAAVSCDSGSESALTASVSFLVSAGLSAV